MGNRQDSTALANCLFFSDRNMKLAERLQLYWNNNDNDIEYGQDDDDRNSAVLQLWLCTSF